MTGEDILELHIHGGHATVKAVLAAIGQCRSKHTIRYADAGEFTRRAFQNDRLDLGQVEALSDALSAETEQQRRAAMRGNSGKLGRIYEEWRQLLLAARGELEALIDFSEDQHFDESPAELMRNVTSQIGPILQAIRRHQKGSRCGELLKRGIRISLLGPPNAGKSSLLNVIVDREASIVSEEAGTTRDIVEVSVDIGGYLCVFADTAGLRSPSSIGGVEQEGIRRAKAKAKDSDLVRLFPLSNRPYESWYIHNSRHPNVLDSGTFKVLSSQNVERDEVHQKLIQFECLPNYEISEFFPRMSNSWGIFYGRHWLVTVPQIVAHSVPLYLIFLRVLGPWKEGILTIY